MTGQNKVGQNSEVEDKISFFFFKHINIYKNVWAASVFSYRGSMLREDFELELQLHVFWGCLQLL